MSVIRIHYTQEIYLKVNCKSIKLTKNKIKRHFLKSVSFVNNRMFWLLQNGSFADSQQKQRASSSDLYHEGLVSHKWWSGCKTGTHGGSASGFPTFA